ncbi:hypothetical protein RGQ15_22335 [Paracoccus sp. MBLB3053]|uniref:Uncharacterized protein n=1 Tax=Paracoccus aurantius TaxID=3073814 RepID=A0ABU2HZ00_9RHOB|nr:hypothetical protein [Paracoccus sp. MBLB3053]MDS9470288.1 hypothetical protein [Paracoccus sp. MBLB3053]
MGRKRISLAVLRRDRGAMTPEELEQLNAVLVTARRHVLEFPADHVMCQAGARLLAAWGEPAPRKRGLVR